MKIIFLALAVVCTPLLALAAGNEGGHGGDPYALEFVTLGNELAQTLAQAQVKDDSLFTKWGFTAAQFMQAVATIRIVSDEGDQVILRGEQVDAINDESGSGQIKVNRSRWREDDLHARMQLVLHEYFGILGVERDKFDASMDFASLVLATTKEITKKSADGTFMANLFYGRSISIPNLANPSTCDSGSPELQKAETSAVTQAQGLCRISGKSNCELINTSYQSVISTTQIGLRYCEVLVIMK